MSYTPGHMRAGHDPSPPFFLSLDPHISPTQGWQGDAPPTLFLLCARGTPKRGRAGPRTTSATARWDLLSADEYRICLQQQRKRAGRRPVPALAVLELHPSRTRCSQTSALPATTQPATPRPRHSCPVREGKYTWPALFSPARVGTGLCESMAWTTPPRRSHPRVFGRWSRLHRAGS